MEIAISAACLNAKFQKRERTQWTYTYPNNSKAQLDYIFINKKWMNSAQNSETYTSFEGVSSDHKIVFAKICQNLCRSKAQTVKA